ncbi:MAG: hypothetical protein ACE5NC_03810 [Anaerolineae bacterium]
MSLLSTRLFLWTLASVFLYVAAHHLLHRGRRGRPARLARLIAPIQALAEVAGVQQAVSLGFLVGIPYLALIQGVTNPRLMGLAPDDWARSVAGGLVLGAGATAFLLWGWSRYVRSLGSRPPAVERPLLDKVQAVGEPWGWVGVLAQAIALEIHWAFYRGAPQWLLGDFYWGVFGGLAIVYLEDAATPQWRSRLDTPQVGRVAWRWGMALAMAVIFLYTRNLWLTVGIHFVVEMAILRYLQGAYRRWGTAGLEAQGMRSRRATRPAKRVPASSAIRRRSR